MLRFSKVLLLLIEIGLTAFTSLYLVFLISYYNFEAILLLFALAIILNVLGIVIMWKRNKVLLLAILLAVLFYYVVGFGNLGGINLLNLFRYWARNEDILFIVLGITIGYILLGYIAYTEYKKKTLIHKK